MGGSNGSALKNTEFVYANGQIASGPTLDFTIKDHCMVKLSDNKIFIIGGEQNGAVSNQVWIVDPVLNNLYEKEESSFLAQYLKMMMVKAKLSSLGAVIHLKVQWIQLKY